MQNPTLKEINDANKRVISAKANCIIKGLKLHSVQVEKEDLFEPA